MYDSQGSYDDTITTLFNAFDMVGQSWVNALPQATKILRAFR
jgi:hypothetical protein